MIWQVAKPNAPRLLIQVALCWIPKLVHCFQVTEYLGYPLATNSQVLFANRHYSFLRICSWAIDFKRREIGARRFPIGSNEGALHSYRMELGMRRPGFSG